MNDKEIQLYVTRIERFIDRIAAGILGHSVTFEAVCAVSNKPIPFDRRHELEYIPIREGDLWGHAWDSAWFDLKATIPKSWKGQKVVARLDFSGEGLVYSSKGEMIQGISNGSVFTAEFSRDVVRLFDKCKGGDEVQLWVEAAANGLFGVFTEPDPPEDSPRRYGHYDAIVNNMKLCTFDEQLWHLWLDLKILIGLIKTLPDKSVRRARLINTANEAIDAFGDHRENLSACTDKIRTELDKPSSASDLSVLAVGHAHIDTAWLWPISETIRKCARTFSSQIDLMGKYTDYIFGASQPQHYVFVKKHHPDLYKKIKKAVKDGRWEPQGGMWVEADCNLIDGESMIRQILHGKNFFKDEFGFEVKNLWLPDVFGYSAALPQIMKKSGIDFFLTQKLSWNQFNEFPHHTFKWRGIDGSEVITHFPPENNYNSQLGTDYLVPARDHFKEKDFLDEFMSLFGVGDGGGGPKEENIELGRRMADLEGSPRVKFGKAADFFDRLRKHQDKLATWVGELYLELHRGTLTTQARVKKANRELEHKLKVAEFLWSCLSLNNYPADELDEIWKKVLLHQFHDILPGSSITRAYEDTHAEHKELIGRTDKLISQAAQSLFEKDNESVVLLNVLPYRYDGFVSIDPYSFVTLKKTRSINEELGESNNLVLENELIRYEFDKDGSLIRAWDKEYNREILPDESKGNALSLYDDHPNNWDAWDIDLFYENDIVDRAHSISATALSSGELQQGIQFRLGIGRSKIEQTVYLTGNSKRLDFVTTVDWTEKHKMLRVAFPVTVYADQASFDIQYGYVRRPTHRNTSWDMARFEVVGHRYADLSDNDYGVALLNDCKYGYKVLDNVIDLNLLRSPTYPDPDADQGRHEFTYSLLPHVGDLLRSDVIPQAAMLNQKPVLFEGYRATGQGLPWRVSGNGLSLEVVKKAEKEDLLILRIVETLGCHSSGELKIDNTNATLAETDLMEWKDSESVTCEQPITLQLKPFEIKTYKLKG
jgi:alpha-mannosidase